MRAKSPAILQNCRAFLYAIPPPKPPDQSCASPRKRQILTQGREAFRRRPLGESKEAVRKNCLSGAVASCGRALLSARHAQRPKGGYIAGGPLVRGDKLAAPAPRPGKGRLAARAKACLFSKGCCRQGAWAQCLKRKLSTLPGRAEVHISKAYNKSKLPFRPEREFLFTAGRRAAPHQNASTTPPSSAYTVEMPPVGTIITSFSAAQLASRLFCSSSARGAQLQ